MRGSNQEYLKKEVATWANVDLSKASLAVLL